MTVRLSIINLAGMARTLVAVGTSSEADMFFTTAAAAPRNGCVSPPVAGAFAAGLASAGLASEGLGVVGALSALAVDALAVAFGSEGLGFAGALSVAEGAVPLA
ncbi:hypothetical protein MAGR_61340 [Mycolicibacterium agri]|uniref:Uncharacterized protein n=1 Tax=Mycolicibacterium agri TaxID=36811 RepID=A0A7I9WAG0_MYCAG|nr:hypothetical protein MAGR_61340 [Mycolicibacterium agri]